MCYVLCISICFWTLLNVTYCQRHDSQADAIVFEYEPPSDAGYRYKYQTSNGIKRAETGVLVEKKGLLELLVKGSYQYLRPDGKLQTVSYTAGKDGYRPIIKIENLPPVKKNNLHTRIGTAVLASLNGGNSG